MCTFWMSCYKIGCILFNTIFITLQGRMKKNEFGYTFVDSPSLACKIWALENDWEVLLICDPDHRNKRQVFNAMILWRKTQSKKVMRHLNKPNFSSVIWTLEDKARNWKMTYWMERVILPSHLMNSLHIVASVTSMRNPNPYPCILVVLCVNLLKTSHPGSNEGISSHSIEKLKGPPILKIIYQNILDDICLLKHAQIPTKGSGFPSLS